MSEHALEERIRASLHRRAADVDVDAPPWEELVTRASGVVVPLRPTDAGRPPAHLRASRRHRLPRPSLRPALATAAALLVALGAAVVVEGRGGPGPGGDGEGTPTDDGAVALDVPTGPVIPAPGESAFRSDTATPLPSDQVLSGEAQQNPVALANAYLAEAGLFESGYEVRAPTFRAESDEPVETATTGTVWWSVRDTSDFPLHEGGVFLRRARIGPALDGWEVVGIFTRSTLALNGVRRADGALAFTVGDYSVDPNTRVTVDGVEVHDGALPRGTKAFTVEDPAPDRVVTIQVLRLQEGRPVALVAMAVAPDAASVVVESERGGARLPASPSTTAP